MMMMMIHCDKTRRTNGEMRMIFSSVTESELSIHCLQPSYNREDQRTEPSTQYLVVLLMLS